MTPREIGIEALLWTVRIATALLVLVSVLPWLDSGSWRVRIWEFPRLQLAGFAGLAFAGVAFLGQGEGGGIEPYVLGTVLALVAAYQLARVVPFTPLWRKEMATADASLVSERGFRVAICNLDFENPRHAEVERALEERRADLLLMVEVSDEWLSGLRGLRTSFPHRVEDVRPMGLGLALWSRLPLRGAEVRELVTAERPSIRADVELPDGVLLHVVAVHPTPPALPKRDDEGRHDSRIRDAELVLVGREVADRPDEPWLVMGDLNDVAWSKTTRLFRSVSGLQDPRIGRRMCNTYHAQRALLRYPLDHLFASEGFRIRNFGRFRAPGSDHFGVVADLVVPRPKGVDPDPSADEEERAQEVLGEGAQDAADDGDLPYS